MPDRCTPGNLGLGCPHLPSSGSSPALRQTLSLRAFAAKHGVAALDLVISGRRTAAFRRRAADALKTRWCGKAAEFALDKPGKCEGGAVVEVAANNLHANREPLGAATDG